MSIETQLTPATRAERNRENAQHSTGPRTEAGKQAVRLNAVKHGIYSQTVVLPTEDRGAYDALGADLRAQFQPVDEKQSELLQALQDARWSLIRANAVESNLWILAADQQRAAIDERYPAESEQVRQALAEAAGFQINSRQFDQLSRARARVKRELEKALKDLSALKADATAAPSLGFVPQTTRLPDAGTEPSTPETGFVSQGAASPEAASEPITLATGFVPSNPEPVTLPTGFVPSNLEPLVTGASASRVQMPKFSGPNAKKDRKRWLRLQAKKNAVA